MNRRDFLRSVGIGTVGVTLPSSLLFANQLEKNASDRPNIQLSGKYLSRQVIAKYNVFEITLEQSINGNPFLDVQLSAVFEHQEYRTKVSGFYDGDGKFKIRFMPQLEGFWSYYTNSNLKALNNKKGSFDCIQPSEKIHGVVRVANTFFFEYDDGTLFCPFGTTCYAWIHQSEDIQVETLETLKKAVFNKIRMCVFPKWYEFNRSEPELYPYQGKAPNHWDFWRFNPEFFCNLEKRIAQLNKLGIECDLILFHPYDEGHWGFDRMTREQDDFYLRYIIARLSSFRNIWWSVANEWDFMKEKQKEDFDRIFKIIKEEDPYNHLRSIHNGVKWYDQKNPLVTHLSVQGDPWQDSGVGEGPQKIDEWKRIYKKPLIMDEMKYEGNIRYSFGDLTAQEMTDRFWYTITKGAYATHGETYINSCDIIWWAKGGKLYGESPDRIAFLRKIVENAPQDGLEVYNRTEEDGNAVRVVQKYFLFYFGARQPAERWLILPDDKKYGLDIINTWDMTIKPLEGQYGGRTLIKLPGKPYIAVRAILVE